MAEPKTSFALVAVMVAAPAAEPLALTCPFWSTVATAEPPFDHTTGMPAGVVVAVRLMVLPGPVAKMVPVLGVTFTPMAGGLITWTLAVPCFPPLVAVMVTVPVSLAPTGVTNPAADTVAIPVLLD